MNEECTHGWLGMATKSLLFCFNFEPGRVADEIELEVELVVISVETAWQVIGQLIGERIGIVSSA